MNLILMSVLCPHPYIKIKGAKYVVTTKVRDNLQYSDLGKVEKMGKHDERQQQYTK